MATNWVRPSVTTATSRFRMHTMVTLVDVAVKAGLEVGFVGLVWVLLGEPS